MDDFGRFCYLDVQKTGSTFITKILKEVSLLKILASSKHAPIENLQFRHLKRALNKVEFQKFTGGLYRRSCYYFNSIRSPFDYYASLYNYGCDSKGKLAMTLTQNGHGKLYDNTTEGFLRWVQFILDSKNSAYLDWEYDKTCARFIGIHTYRFLRLSVANPTAVMKQILSLSDAREVYMKRKICSYTIKNETLNHDLSFLFQNPLKEYVRPDAIDILQKTKKINASSSRAASGDLLKNSDVASLVLARDILIFENFYAQDHR